jgi:hypothetical protein
MRRLRSVPSTMAPVEYPEWVPAAVVKAAEEIVAPCVLFGKDGPFTIDPDDMDMAYMEIARRLVTAPEMKDVSRRLLKYPYNADGVRACKEELWLDGPGTHDDALRQFFWHAVRRDLGPGSSAIKRMATEVQQNLELAARLRQTAEDWDFAGEYEEAAVFLRGAEILEGYAASETRRMQEEPGKRRQGQNYPRSYAVKLAEVADSFFVFPTPNALHTVVAVVTTVFFNKATVTNANVKYWLDAHAKVQT